MMKNIFKSMIFISVISIAWANYGNAQNEIQQQSQPSHLPSSQSPPFQDDFPLFPDEYEPVEATYRPQAYQEESNLSAILDTRLGIRTQSSIHQDEFSIGEARLQFKYEHKVEAMTFNASADLVVDPILDQYDIRLKDGTGLIDIRKLNLTFIPSDYMDLILGRQTLSWGTGDLMFINNLFPKDWQALFIGRDESYFNAPTDAVKLGFYSMFMNMDLVYVPWFDRDRIPSGERFGYYNSVSGQRVGQNQVMDFEKRDDLFDDDEWATRLYNTFGDLELALYTYYGYWKSPGGIEPFSWKRTYPRLNVYGFSAQGPVAHGMACFEMGLYESRDDKAGGNPYINNSQLRLLFGYRFDLPNQMQLSTQYYIEIMRDHQKYQESLAEDSPPNDEGRHVITVRLTRQLTHPNIHMSLLTYYCPTDTDLYARPTIQYIFDNNFTLLTGANIFVGNEDHTHWGQYERDSNIYVGMQYRF